MRVGLNPLGASFIQLSDVEFASFMLAHELGHRTGKLIPDGSDRSNALSISNNGAVHKACFGDIPAHSSGMP